MLFLQYNPAIHGYVYIGKPIVFDPEVLPAPYQILAEVQESVKDAFAPYRYDGLRDGFYRIDLNKALRIIDAEQKKRE